MGDLANDCPQEFLKNVKREFSKLVAVLQAYALIATRVRLIATNQVRGQKGQEVCEVHFGHQVCHRVCDTERQLSDCCLSGLIAAAWPI